MRRSLVMIVLVLFSCGFAIPCSYGTPVTVTIPDPGSVGFINLGTGNASVTYSGVAFSQSAGLSDGTFFNVGTLANGGYPAVLSSQEQSFGVANILISLPVTVSSFALNYDTFDGSNVTFSLSNGSSMTLGSTGNGYAASDVYSVTGGAFNSVEVTTGDIVLAINNITYTPGSSSPEPGTLILLGSGLLALGRARLRKNLW